MRKAGYAIDLLGGFVLWQDSVAQDVPRAGQRLLAHLALSPRRLRHRDALAAVLRPDAGQAKAQGSLRSALWRLSRSHPALLHVRSDAVSLVPTVLVDVDLLTALPEGDPPTPASGPTDAVPDVDLLPGWDDEWLEPERERVRQRWLHALEDLARRRCSEGRHGAALEAALRVLAADPLRESAHRLVIDVHLAEGNAVEAARQSERCRRLLSEQLGVAPTVDLRDVARPVVLLDTAAPRAPRQRRP